MDLSEIENLARARLDAAFAAREQGIADSRKVIRSSANAIRSLHRGETSAAEALMGEAATALHRTTEVLAAHPSVLYAGFIADAAKEYVEARITEALFRGRSIPGFAELGVDPVPFLHGLGEAVGELRRRLLDLLRDGELDPAVQTLEAMDDIVDLLASLDYPDGMTGGLRRVTDVARALVERSRSDLTATAVQERLRKELSERLG